ncbi:hypothetical protein LSTR_LSTR011996 [Laodelphax striatellus]|uniref:HTH psq-type domain-containing protein n=1 Tax=Laodelphax striatellus TaxID=195883 RepID=A0A482XJN1_LAOST|nr:hypothetical protein LSTR_LSTR011996 [Laodelphax striatellus]
MNKVSFTDNFAHIYAVSPVPRRKPEKNQLVMCNFNKFNVDKFFDNLEDVRRRFGPFPPERIWNQDETGVTTVQNPPNIVAPKGTKQDIMPRSKEGKRRNPVDPESMEKAVRAVTAPPEKRISIREACKVFNVKFTTLVCNLQSFKTSGSTKYVYEMKCDVKKVFTEEEELKLVHYIKTVARMNYCLTKKQVHELPYKFAVAKQKKFPQHGLKVKQQEKNG